MHDEILSDAQRELLPLMAQFRREYYLVGGTAIALHIGHRRSEVVEYLISNPPTDEEIKAELTRISLDGV